MILFEALSNLEKNDSLHLGRLLILLNAFSGKDGDEPIEGLTKLAKLDFLLRYPVYLERALIAKNQSTKFVLVAEHEKLSVESSMVRFRYGPWDFRYRRFINLLVAKGLVKISLEGRTIELSLTLSGRTIADELSTDPAYAELARRANILRIHFNQSGTTLMKFVYETFPEIATLRLGESINA